MWINKANACEQMFFLQKLLLLPLSSVQDKKERTGENLLGVNALLAAVAAVASSSTESLICSPMYEMTLGPDHDDAIALGAEKERQ